MRALAGRARPARREPAARAVLLRPRHRPARRHHAHVQHRDRRGQPAHVSRTADSTSRAFRRRPGGRGEHRRRRRRAAFGLRARGAASAHAVRGPPLRARRHAAAADARAGAACDADASERRAYAGPFRDLRAAGEVARDGVRATTRYRFTPRLIEARWALRAARRVAATVTFPSWGRGARVDARLRDGRTVRVGSGRRAERRVGPLDAAPSALLRSSDARELRERDPAEERGAERIDRHADVRAAAGALCVTTRDRPGADVLREVRVGRDLDGEGAGQRVR